MGGHSYKSGVTSVGAIHGAGVENGVMSVTSGGAIRGEGVDRFPVKMSATHW